MATAFTEKTKNEQLSNHTVSSAAQHESMCTRCGGLMVDDFCMDVIGIIGQAEFVAKRCEQCGEVVDCAILLNRQLRQEPMTVQHAEKMLQNNCVMEGR